MVREENRNRSLGPEGPDIVDEAEEPNTPFEAKPLGLLFAHEKSNRAESIEWRYGKQVEDAEQDVQRKEQA